MPKNNSKPNRERRTREAAERQKVYSALPVLQAIERLKSRPGKSQRELDRLNQEKKNND